MISASIFAPQSVEQPFDSEKFNFNKVDRSKELVFHGKNFQGKSFDSFKAKGTDGKQSCF